MNMMMKFQKQTSTTDKSAAKDQADFAVSEMVAAAVDGPLDAGRRVSFGSFADSVSSALSSTKTLVSTTVLNAKR